MRHAARTRKRLVFARHELVAPGLAGARPAVLLEGSWPAGASPDLFGSLDDEIDARFQWIDEEASHLAEQLAEGRPENNSGTVPIFPQGKWDCPPAAPEDLAFPSINPAWLNALGLRYYLVKLIRLAVYFTEVRPLGEGQTLQLVAAKGRDEDYADLTAALCRLAGACCRVEWIDRPGAAAPSFAANRRWRRGLARLLGLVDRSCPDSASRGRVVLCGNPRLLDPVCRELVRRGADVWWLYDRFAMRSWLRWRAFGVGQLVCDSSQSGTVPIRPQGKWDCPPPNPRSHLPPALKPLEFRGVDLTGPVRRWIGDRLKSHGPQQTRILERINAHFRRVRPEALILDEDATPMARAAVGLARRHGAASFVVQHGAPACRFGFAPAAADRILAWGESSRKQLAAWGVPAKQIQAVGSPMHETLLQRLSRAVNGRFRRRVIGAARPRPPRILLLTTVPPRDDRPDAVALHLNRRTYAQMLRTALAAVSTIPGAELVVKLHPRAPDDPIALAAIAAFGSLRERPINDFPVWEGDSPIFPAGKSGQSPSHSPGACKTRVVRSGSLAPWLAWTDCVLSCISSAGVDATLTGVPVIQLLPAGSGDVLPHREWGMLGTARTEEELQPLLLNALDGRRPGGAGASPVLRSKHGQDARATHKSVGWVEQGETHDDADKPSAANPNPNVFAHLDGRAAERIAEAALGSKGGGEIRRPPTHPVQRRAA